MDVSKGTMLTQDADGATRSVTGLSFQPKVVFLWASVRSAVGIGATGGQMTFGAASSTTDMGCVCARTKDAVATTDTWRYVRTDACFVHIEDTGVLQGYCKLQSFNTDGFTLVWTDAMTVQWPIQYLAIGGADLLNVKVGSFQITSSGSQSVTGVGFIPDAVMVWGARQDTVNTGTAHAHFHMGAADGGVQWAQAVADLDNTAGTQGITTSSGSEFIRLMDDAGAVDCQATFTSFGSDGFTINVTNAPSATIRVFYVAFAARGGVDVQQDTKPVTNTTKATTAQDPDAVLFCTVVTATDNTTTTTANTSGTGVMALEIGAMTGSAQGMTGYWSDDAQATSNAASSEATDKVMFMGEPQASAVPTSLGTAVFSALGPTSYTLSWSGTTAVAHRFGSITFGVPTAVTQKKLSALGAG